MLKNEVEMERRRLDFSDESSDDGHDNSYLGFHEYNARRADAYEREVGRRSGNLISSRHHSWGGGYSREADSVGKKSHNMAQQENRDNSRLDMPVPIEIKEPHYSSEYFGASDSEEFEEKLTSLRFLILEAEEEMRNIVRGRIEKHLKTNKEVNERKREMKRRKREVLGEINKEEAKGESKEGDSPETSQEDSDSRRAKIESFADFETSMFPYKSKNGIKSYICPYEGCTMELPTLSRIKRHYIVHTKLRPFKCLNKDCSKRFSRKDNMLQHYKIHCSYSNYR